MRVLLIAQQFRDFHTGLGTYARMLVEGLLERADTEVTIATPEVQTMELPGARVVPLDFEPATVTPFSSRGLAPEIRRAFASEHRDHDVVHFLDAREIGFLASDRVDTPVLGTIHDTYALDWQVDGYPRHLYRDRFVRGLYYRWLRRFERGAYARAGRLIANSRYVADSVARGYGVPPRSLEVVRIGLRDAEPPARADLPGNPAVLFVGANVTRKGLPTLLVALERLLPSFPDLRLHVIGGPAPFTLPVWVAHHGGRVPNERVLAMMAGADVFALPSYVEAFGLVYLEAMRAGTPVVATARGGAAECFADGDEALLVPPADPDALESALRRILEDRELRTHLVRGGRRVLARLSPADMVQRTRELYEHAIE